MNVHYFALYYKYLLQFTHGDLDSESDTDNIW